MAFIILGDFHMAYFIKRIYVFTLNSVCLKCCLFNTLKSVMALKEETRDTSHF